MQTDLPREWLATVEGARADAILRSCVHCGFCNATCPTYQLLGDELDGPRGRIYLLKDMLENQQVDPVAVRHLDRCLTCRACETTCPSGVRYGELLEIGREYLEEQRSHPGRRPRNRRQRWMRAVLLRVVPRWRRFRRVLALGRLFRALLPKRLASRVPSRGAVTGLGAATRSAPATPPSGRRVVLLQGCVQRAVTPAVNATLAALLVHRGIDVGWAEAETCCGALALHLGEGDRARDTMAANVAALAPMLEDAEVLISTASGCGVTVKDYGRLLAGREAVAGDAERVATHTLDVAEFLHRLPCEWQRREPYRRVAWHAPCTLQHGQHVDALAASLLQRAGYELVPVREPHLCCGSAGTYSLLQPALSDQLRRRKLSALQQANPDVIATANVGCQLHLLTDAAVPVVHWLELLA